MVADAVTKPPAMTATERQANRRQRMAADIEAGRVARYQVQSFQTLITSAAALGIELHINPRDFPLDNAIEELNRKLLDGVRWAEVERLKASAPSDESPFRPVTHVDADGNAVAVAKESRKRGKPTPTVTPTHGGAKAVRTRKRAAK